MSSKDYRVKIEIFGRKKQGKREYLNNLKTKQLIKKLEKFFDSTVEIPRIKVGKRQTIQTLISEETLLFAKNLRSGIQVWIPRIISFSTNNV